MNKFRRRHRKDCQGFSLYETYLCRLFFFSKFIVLSPYFMNTHTPAGYSPNTNRKFPKGRDFVKSRLTMDWEDVKWSGDRIELNLKSFKLFHMTPRNVHHAESRCRQIKLNLKLSTQKKYLFCSYLSTEII